MVWYMSILLLKLVTEFHRRIASFPLEQLLSVTQVVFVLPGLLVWHSRCGFVIGRSRMGGITVKGRSSLVLVDDEYRAYNVIGQRAGGGPPPLPKRARVFD